MIRLITLTLSILLCCSNYVLAINNPEKKYSSQKKHANKSSSNIKVKENDVLVKVHGMVCSFCAKGIQKKLAKLKFVNTKRYKQGSKGNISKQKIIVAIKPQKTANIPAIYQAIRSAGYKPQAAYKLNNQGNLIKFNARGKQCPSLSC